MIAFCPAVVCHNASDQIFDDDDDDDDHGVDAIIIFTAVPV